MDFPLQTDKRQKLGRKLILCIIIQFSLALVVQTAWANFLSMFDDLRIILIVLVISWQSIVLGYHYQLINRGKLAFFGVNFILQKIYLCKKNDKYQV